MKIKEIIVVEGKMIQTCYKVALTVIPLKQMVPICQ